MESLNVNETLPKNLRINCAENHLYKIGLCLTSSGQTRRHLIHNPVLIFIVNIISIMKTIISLLLNEEYDHILIINGDFSHFLEVRIHFNIACNLYILLALTSQLIYYYNYKYSIKPTYLKVFEMMSGLVSPKSIGLTKEEEIYGIISITKISYFVCKIITEKIIPISAMALIMIPYLMNCTIMEIIVYGIPHTILFSLMCYYVYSINIRQMVYFIIICHYIKVKIRELIKNILLINKVKRYYKQYERIHRSLNSVYSEINEYNSNFWSKYMLTIWFVFGTDVDAVLYCALFSEVNIVCEMLFKFGFILLFTNFIFIINTASSVHLEAKKSFKLLNKLMACNQRTFSYKMNLKVRKIEIILKTFFKNFFVNRSLVNDSNRKSWREKSWIFVLEIIHY
jgi:hypothetical protein